jgi:hypothetical protein
MVEEAKAAPVPQVVTNKSDNPLAFPGGEVVHPNTAGEIADWAAAQENAMVQTWLEEGMVEEGDTTLQKEEDETEEEFELRVAEDNEQREEVKAQKKRQEADQRRRS